jgi:hypothetical protein
LQMLLIQYFASLTSTKNVEAYWFFMPKTNPDKELLTLLDNSKHEIVLHIVNDPYRESKLLEASKNARCFFHHRVRQ